MNVQEKAILVRYIRKHLKELARRLSEIDTDEVVEAVHKARVACRRLRTALQAGRRGLIPRKRARRWLRRLRRLARVLSPVRDVDVQLQTLGAHMDRLRGTPHQSGVERLALRLRQQRERLQQPMLQGVARFRKRKTLAEMITWAHEKRARKSPPGRRGGLSARVGKRIARRLDQVLEQSSSLRDPEDQQGHHALRVAVKRLRYTMEIWQPALDGHIGAALDTCHRLQELLGTIHDCDILGVRLDQFLEQERQRTEEYFGHLRSFRRIERAIEAYRRQLQQQREEAFQRLQEQWNRLDRQGFWHELRAMVHRSVAHRRGEESVENGDAAEPRCPQRPHSATVASEPGKDDSNGNRPPAADSPAETPGKERLREPAEGNAQRSGPHSEGSR